jgi:hypothetical protein
MSTKNRWHLLERRAKKRSKNGFNGGDPFKDHLALSPPPLEDLESLEPDLPAASLPDNFLKPKFVLVTTSCAAAPIGSPLGSSPNGTVSVTPKAKGFPRKKWTSKEDQALRNLVDQNGAENWASIASYLPGRKAKQCQERWSRHLASHLNLSPWTSEEDTLLLQKFSALGPRWTQIAEFFPGRSDISCRNEYGKLQRRQPKTDREERPLAEKQTPPASPESGILWYDVESNIPPLGPDDDDILFHPRTEEDDHLKL